MQYEILPTGAFEANCVLLWKRGQRHAWVVDPGADADAILAALARHNLTVAQVVLTHGHIDHLSALETLLARQPAPVLMHPSDAAWAFTAANSFPPYVRVPPRPASLAATLPDGLEVTVGGLTGRLLHTPGHSPGCVCLYFADDKLLVSGDTLFAGSVGRTDLPGGSARTLGQSLKRLAELPDDVIVIPGHGPTTTIGAEKRINPFMKTRPAPR